MKKYNDNVSTTMHTLKKAIKNNQRRCFKPFQNFSRQADRHHQVLQGTWLGPKDETWWSCGDQKGVVL